MENEKKIYETPVVTKVEYDTSDRITASACSSTNQIILYDFSSCNYPI